MNNILQNTLEGLEARAYKPSAHNFIDIKGLRFGKLIVVMCIGIKKAKTQWLCRCDCGKEKIIVYGNLKNGNTKSCGCSSRAHKITHGMSHTPEHNAYLGAKNRCNNKNEKGYKNYGGRGVEFRFKSFEEFYEELGDRPSKKHSIDRINNNGHYEKENVRWATQKHQARNKRTTRFYTLNGVTKTLPGWSEHYKINSKIVRQRMSREGWNILKALTTPVRSKTTKH